jgi:hypothetical protein
MMTVPMVPPAPVMVVAPTPVAVVPMMMMPAMAPVHLLRRQPAGLLARRHRAMNVSVGRMWYLAHDRRRRQWRGVGIRHRKRGPGGNAKSENQGHFEKTKMLHALLRIQGFDREEICAGGLNGD